MRLIAAAAALLLTACAVFEPPPEDRYAGDLTGLELVAGPNGGFTYVRPGFDPDRYDTLLVEPIGFYFLNPGFNPVASADIERMRRYFAGALANADLGRWRVVEEPAPDVLRLRTALTGLDAGGPLPGEVEVSRSDVMILTERAAGQIELRDPLTRRPLLAILEPSGDGNLLDADGRLAGTRMAFGRDLDAVLHPARADVIAQLDGDFLSELPGSLAYAREFARRREPRESMSRLYVAESVPGLAGAMADHAMPVAAPRIAAVARGLAAALGFAPAVLHYALMGLVSLTAVAAFDAVGSIIVIAMFICPPAAARLMTDRLERQVAWSVVFAILSAVLGYVLAGYGPLWLGGNEALSAAGMIATVSGLILAGLFGALALTLAPAAASADDAGFFLLGGVGVFVVAGLLAATVAGLSVSYQAWTAAQTDPARTLRGE